MIEFTAFPSIYDNKTHRKFSFKDWDAFKAALFNMSKNLVTNHVKAKKVISNQVRL